MVYVLGQEGTACEEMVFPSLWALLLLCTVCSHGTVLIQKLESRFPRLLNRQSVQPLSVAAEEGAPTGW